MMDARRAVALFGVVAQRGLDGGSVMIDGRAHAVALFGFVAASTAGRPSKDDAYLFSGV